MKAVRVLNDVFATDGFGMARVETAAGTVVRADEAGMRFVALRNGEEIDVADDYFDPKPEATEEALADGGEAAAGDAAGEAAPQGDQPAAETAPEAAAGEASAAEVAAVTPAAPTSTKAKKAAAAA